MAILLGSDHEVEVTPKEEWWLPADDNLTCATDPFDDFDDDFDDDFEEEWDDDLLGDSEFESEFTNDDGGKKVRDDPDFDDK